jgi:hypothetical protein
MLIPLHFFFTFCEWDFVRMLRELKIRVFFEIVFSLVQCDPEERDACDAACNGG